MNGNIQQPPILFDVVSRYRAMTVKRRKKEAIKLKYLQLVLIELNEGYFNLNEFRRVFKAEWKYNNYEPSKRYLMRLIKMGYVTRYRLQGKRLKSYGYNLTRKLKDRLNRL